MQYVSDTSEANNLFGGVLEVYVQIIQLCNFFALIKSYSATIPKLTKVYNV